MVVWVFGFRSWVAGGTVASVVNARASGARTNELMALSAGLTTAMVELMVLTAVAVAFGPTSLRPRPRLRGMPARPYNATTLKSAIGNRGAAK
jgi:hypothetical protein